MRTLSASLSLVAVLAAGAGGYWAGQAGVTVARIQTMIGLAPAGAEPMAAARVVAAETAGAGGATATLPASGPVLYWRDPDGKAAYSAGPRKAADGRDFLPVRVEGAGVPGAEATMASAAMPGGPEPTTSPVASGAEGGKTILYYRNPMGLPDTSPMPKQDSMGMDYIPVYDGPDEEEGIVTVSPGRLQRTGVRSVAVTRQAIGRPLKVPGVVKLDERRIKVVTTRADAFVEAVADVTTGAAVKKGEPLMRLYSPDMAAASAQFVIELKGAGAARSGGARLKLRNLGVPETAIAEMEKTREVPMSMTWAAPQDGLILERMAVDGMMTKAGDVLFRLADASRVWMIADVPESEIAAVRLGARAQASLRGLPGRTFEGTVDLVYPEVAAETRTVKVRIEMENAEGLLRPDMYADVDIDTGSGRSVVAVPNDALLDSGTRQVVILDRGEGRFEPRPVKLGARGEDMTEIADGVVEGDRVVVGANFLIDAESNIKAALSALDPGKDATAGSAPDRAVQASEVRP